MADWVTISALATAGGTLVLAGTTYASVRSANRAARVAEGTLLAGLRPLIVTSSSEDRLQHAGFGDRVILTLPGGRADVQVVEGRVYMAISLRNVGPGIGVLHGGFVGPVPESGDTDHAPLDAFRRLTRDLYIPPGEIGFWQTAFRDDDPEREAALALVDEGRFRVELLYGDYEGGQRVVTRFGVGRLDDGWTTTVIRHWQVDRRNPR
ncbi:MAG: hypothetical protein JOY73_02630 [Actinobacteria bacterium]|nr:hypothetical protein [Actinomycetota bacterium]